MAIRKEERTGWWRIFYWVPVRTARRRYHKVPIIRPQNSLTAFLRDLFRGGPNPFRASPIAIAIDRSNGLERRAKRASRENSRAEADELVQAADAELDRYLRNSSNDADYVLDELDIETNKEEVQLDNCRAQTVKADMIGELEEVIRDVDLHLGPSADRLMRAKEASAKFDQDHDLYSKKGLHRGKALTRDSIYFIITVTVVELVLNALFFSSTQRTGLIGGAGLAILLSIATIFLGILFGWAYQFSDSRAEGGGWRGRLGLLALLVVATFYLLLLTLARRAGEAGDLQMFGTAAQQITADPLAGLLDLPALVYCFFTVGVIVWVAWKFVSIMGNFPQVRAHMLAEKAAEDEFNAIRLGMVESLEQHIDTFIEKLDALPDMIQTRKLALQEIAIDYENAIDQFRHNIEEIKDAGNIILAVIRRYVPPGEIPYALDLEYESRIEHFAQRLERFEARIDKLLNRPEVSPAAIEKCRAEMAELGKRKRKELETRCASRAKAAGAPTTPPRPRARKGDNVAWLQRKPA